MEDSRPHWTQWFPYFGFFSTIRAANRGKPSLAKEDEEHVKRFYLSAIWHGVWLGLLLVAIVFILVS